MQYALVVLSLVAGFLLQLLTLFGYHTITWSRLPRPKNVSVPTVSDIAIREPTPKNVRDAYYIHLPGSEVSSTREKRLISEFSKVLPHISMHRVVAVPLVQHSHLNEVWQQQVLSNKMSHLHAWNLFAVDDTAGEWAIFLEDDAVFHEKIRDNATMASDAVEHLAELASSSTGFAYLGLCQPNPPDKEWTDPTTCAGRVHHARHADDAGVPFAYACGLCAHAYMMNKRLAKKLGKDLEDYVQRTKPCAPGKCCPSSEQHRMQDPMLNIFMDQMLYCYSTDEESWGGAWLAGASWESPLEAGHMGLLYQDRRIGYSIQY